ncbi:MULTISPECIES: hypothetical protein [unclassified Leifsonia]|uniref:hypothetical protein n=1 Tax=unclassified Leifsonia TaxID=2663824 RepID=UPI0012FB3B80|nr:MULTISPECIES: hypothetical protein [unclassified Leifsonia]
MALTAATLNLAPRRPLSTSMASVPIAGVAVLIAVQFVASVFGASLGSIGPAGIVTLVLLITTYTAVFWVVAIAAWRGRRWARVGATVLSAGSLWFASSLLLVAVIAAVIIVAATLLLWTNDARRYALAVWRSRR